MSEPRPDANSRSERKIGRDALGLALMAVAAFSGISAFLALRSAPAEAGGTTGFYGALVQWLGGPACLCGSAGLAWIGIRLWLGGVSDRIARDLLAIALTSLAVSVLVGTFSPRLGGSFGDLIGGSVARRLTPFVAVPFGLAVLALPIWYLWVRPRSRGANAFPENLAPRPAERSDAALPSQPRAVALGEDPLLEAGLTRAETRNLAGTSTVRSAAPSPYPPDVRLTGGIPEGARPLPTTDVRSLHQSPHRAPTLPHGAPPARERAVERSGPDLAATARGVGADERADEPIDLERDLGANAAPAVARPAAGVVPEADLEDESLDLDDLDEPFDDIDLDEEDEARGAEEDRIEIPAPAESADLTRPVSRTPPAPSWEQPGLFDEEPVDAYGTPISVVERLRSDGEAEPTPEVAAAPTGPLLFADAESTVEPEPAIDEEPTAQAKPEPHVELEPESEPEPEVVLEPRPPPPVAVDEVVYKAGCLFLDRKRVAVSMLQREFELDFAAATGVLDQLQKLGLIGPYLGGQRRDILLTPEEWRERVGAV